MISIIICSRLKEINPALTKNINVSIGVDHEIVVIDNSENRYNIFEAYNTGVARSKGAILCFIHDDIKFHSKNWGVNVEKHFLDPQTGAIGNAGSPYVSRFPGSWWANGLVDENIVVCGDGQHKSSKRYSDKLPAEKKQVVVLDGMFLCIKKELFNTIKFDDLTYDGFHFYDIDICLQIAKMQFRLYCTYDISIEHFSKGNVNQNWIDNAIKANQKWKKQVPCASVKLTHLQKIEGDIKTLREFAEILIANGHSKKRTYFFCFRNLICTVPRFLKYNV